MEASVRVPKMRDEPTGAEANSLLGAVTSRRGAVSPAGRHAERSVYLCLESFQ